MNSQITIDLIFSASPLVAPVILVVAGSVSLGRVLIRGNGSGLLLAVGVIGFAQIVGIGLFLSVIGEFNRTGFLLGHLIFALGSIMLLVRVYVREGWQVLPRPDRGRKSLALGIGFLAFLAVAGIYPYFVPSFIVDSESYHLPRAYFWLQQGFVGAFPTGDFRMVEWPPDSSILFAWMMAWAGTGTPWLHLPQLVAGGMMVIGTYSLARLIGCTRSKSALAGFLMAMSPVAILQLGTTQNDLIAAFAFLSLTIFSIRYVRQTSAPADLWLAGVAFGLAVGVKYTVFFGLPALWVLGMALAFERFPPKIAWRKLSALALACVVCFALLGSLTYVANWTEYGDPFGSDTAIQIHQSEETGETVLNNALAYTLQTSNAPAYIIQVGYVFALIFDSGELSDLIRAVAIAPYEYLSGLTAMPDEQFGRLVTQISYIGPSATRGGLGIPSFLLLLMSPILVLSGLIRYYKSRETHDVFVTGFLLVAISFVLLLASPLAWSPNKIRYFLIFQPLLLAGCVLFLSRRSRFGLLWLLPLVVMAATEGLFNLSAGHHGERVREYVHRLAQPGKGAIHHHEGGLQVAQLDLIRAVTVPGDRIGISTKIDVPIYHLVRELPEVEFVPLEPDEIGRHLDAEKISAALITWDRLPADWQSAWSDLQIVLRPLVNDRELFLVIKLTRWLNLDPVLVGLVESETGRVKIDEPFITTYTRTLRGRWQASRPTLAFWLPTWLLPMDRLDRNTPLSITIGFDPVPQASAIMAYCREGLELDVTQLENLLQVEMPAPCIQQDPQYPGTLLILKKSDSGDLRLVSIEMEQQERIGHRHSMPTPPGFNDGPVPPEARDDTGKADGIPH